MIDKRKAKRCPRCKSLIKIAEWDNHKKLHEDQTTFIGKDGEVLTQGVTEDVIK